MSLQVFLFFVITAVLFGILGFFVSGLIQKNKSDLHAVIKANLESDLNKLESEKQNLDSLLTSKEEALNYFQEQLNSLRIKLKEEKMRSNNLEEKLGLQEKERHATHVKNQQTFELLAAKILEEKTAKFTLQNKENIENVLNPLKDRIKEFELKIEDSTNENISRSAALKQQIEHLSQLNKSITQETHNLTRALKGDHKIQGNWGELVLKRVLEKSGLEKGREYFEQESQRNTEGKLQKPDFVIKLPDSKILIIDSKVSLSAYESYVNATTPEEGKEFSKKNLLSIKNHVQGLSEKNYHDLYAQSPDFVLLFIPIEPAFALALKEDNSLYTMAFDKNIVIVTPTTLLATLSTIDSMWTGQKQQQNAVEIATYAGKMYDQFVNLLSELEKLGKQLQTVGNTYESTMTKLHGKGNLIGKVEKLKTLGAKANKTIAEKWK